MTMSSMFSSSKLYIVEEREESEEEDLRVVEGEGGGNIC